jgi:rhamnogalacturonan endolyase
MDNLNLQGYVPASGRGTVSGSYSGTLSGQPVTIGFKVRKEKGQVGGENAFF